jgi:hypothetical protein
MGHVANLFIDERQNLRVPMFRQLTAAILVSALATPAVLNASAQAPGQPGYKRALLASFAGNFVSVQAQYGSNVIAATLESALRKSRDYARKDSFPIPDEVREALRPFYPEEILSSVRYAIGDTTPDGLAGFAIRNGNAAAVTLIDTVVFKDEDYLRNIALWAHELHHVEQYKQWGVLGFASRYAFGWKDVEAEATAKAKEFVAWYRKRTGQE